MRKLVIFVYIIFILGASAAGALVYMLHNPIIDVTILEQYNPGRPSILLDDEGKEWARFMLDRRETITLDRIPHHLIQAFVAAEDHAFFEHSGISYKGIVRSLLVNMYYGKKLQGASTITQQLVRLLFFDAKKTFMRKIKEQICALMIELQFSKEYILQTYLNQVCFGCGIYGVEAASQRFWGKHAHELSLHESATLAAIVKSPNHYCPLLYPLSAQNRRNIVLNSMMQLGFISADEYKKAQLTIVEIKQQEQNGIAPHLKESIRIFLEDLVGKQQLYSGGLIIQTTINRFTQEVAERSFTKQVMQLRKKIGSAADGGLITMDVSTGAIKALIGGFDFSQSKFNRALQARRQVGSILKPIVYAAAIERGIRFDQVAIDEPIQIPINNTIWQPQNATNRFEGTMTLARALSHSNNIIAIKMLLYVGCERVVELAKKFRIAQYIPSYPSLALGCIDATLKEVVGMFNVFANHGVYVEPHFIVWIKDEWGKKIFKHESVFERIINPHISDQVAKVLAINMERQRKKNPQRWFTSDAIGKTGTTNDFRTSFFAGSTPEFTTVLYIGCDDNQSLGNNMFASSTAFPIWFDIYSSIPLHKKKFIYDATLRELLIDDKTGQIRYDTMQPHTIAILI